MRFISTRDDTRCVNFERAVLDCMPQDGGLYVPQDFADLRRWVLYTNEQTTFSSIAGALTSACVNNEFSPIICEAIAVKAFLFSPVLKQISDHLFALELFHTPTGSHKDFGVSFLVNCLETILAMRDDRAKAVILGATTGELGASVASAIRGKKHVKAVLVYPAGCARGLNESDYALSAASGGKGLEGNVFPIEIEGSEEDCCQIVRELFADRAFAAENHLTVANTANIGRLMPQMFFYPYAFSRLKAHVRGDIYYAATPGNYSNLVAGLYGWKLSLPVNGFICPASPELTVDALGQCVVPDNLVPLQKRERADPASPSNIERLENIFHNNALMLKNLVFVSKVDSFQTEEACRALFTQYGILADEYTSSAYAASQALKDLTSDDDSSIVLVERDHPSLSASFISHATGEAPILPKHVAAALTPSKTPLPPQKLTQARATITKIITALN